MERHRCKLCYRKFANGRALGGHMRSHMMNLPLPPKPDPPPPPLSLKPGCDTVSSPESPSLSHFSCSSSSGSEHEDQMNSPDHGVEDEQVFFQQSTEPTGSSTLVTLQDRESETESFKKNPTRRRSKRTTSSTNSLTRNYNDSHMENEHYHHQHLNEVGGGNNNNNNMLTSVSPVSSISEVTSDEDLAYCLMMMSRDKRKYKYIYDSSTSSKAKKYKCETCNKVFRSYQALGGHRASHKKIRVHSNFDLHVSNTFSSEVQGTVELPLNEREEAQQQLQTQKKLHECPVCFRVFSSGQALGGHKRSHVLISGGDYGNTGTNQDYSSPLSIVNDDDEGPKKMKTKMMVVINGSNNNNESLIDLNLPAPVDYEDDDNEAETSQIDDVLL